MKPKALSKLMWTLDHGTIEERCRTLTILCPCRNRVYDREIWQMIFHARESEDPRVRDRAEHAIETFNQVAMKEIRWRDLAFQLKKDADLSLPMPTIGDFFSKELSKVELLRQEGKLAKILYKVKSDKKATIYCCQAHPSTGMELLAAKVYRRNPDFEKKTGRGHKAQASYEFETLRLLHAAGADVPKPIAYSGSSILMEWVAAPPLKNISIEKDDARRLFELLMRNIELWLSFGRVHGELSESNILYWKGKVKVIDFAQAMIPLRAPMDLQFWCAILVICVVTFRNTASRPSRIGWLKGFGEDTPG